MAAFWGSIITTQTDGTAAEQYGLLKAHTGSRGPPDISQAIYDKTHSSDISVAHTFSSKLVDFNQKKFVLGPVTISPKL